MRQLSTRDQNDTDVNNYALYASLDPPLLMLKKEFYIWLPKLLSWPYPGEVNLICDTLFVHAIIE